jgi:DNA-binding NtrC family response regulator
MFIKALLDLKREVDDLKTKVYGDSSAPKIVAGPEMEAEWQGQGTPLTSADVDGSRTIDVQKREEPEEQEAATGGNLSVKNAEKDLIIKALQRSGGNRKQAAEDLGFSERTLYRKIEKYNIEEGQKK